MSDIKFDIYESPANDGEKKKYHVRNTNKQTIHSKDLIHEATLYTSVSRSDWAAVVEGLIDILSEKLGDGKRIHINGLGYFSVSIGSTESENLHTVDLSPIEVDGLLSEYFKDHRSITCARMQQVCGMTRSTAYRRLQALTQGVHPSLQREGYKNATAYIPVKGHYGRSYTADRW